MANEFFVANSLPHRFKNDQADLRDDVYDVYMAKKTNGKPKDDLPPFELKMSVKQAKVKQNRFSVVFSEDAITSAELAAPVKELIKAVVAPQKAALLTVEKNEHSMLETTASTNPSPMSAQTTSVVVSDGYGERDTLNKGITADKKIEVKQVAQPEPQKGCCILF